MMNIIDFFMQDHEKLGRVRLEIGKSLIHNVLLKDKVKDYISYFELHETMEDEFLIAPITQLTDSKEKIELLQSLTDEHHKIWDLISKLWDSVNYRRGFVQQAYFDLFAYTELHIRDEEQLYFPQARKLLGQEKLDELGDKAQKYYDHYHAQC